MTSTASWCMIQPKVDLLVLLLDYILTMYPNGQRTLSPLLFKTLPHTVLPGPSQSVAMHRLDFVSSRTMTYAIWKVAILLLRHGLASDFSGLLSLISSNCFHHLDANLWTPILTCLFLTLLSCWAYSILDTCLTAGFSRAGVVYPLL